MGRTPHGVRGLKYNVLRLCAINAVSRTPHGVRGLKCGHHHTNHKRQRRTPHGVRGLKYHRRIHRQLGAGVAPLTGCVD